MTTPTATTHHAAENQERPLKAYRVNWCGMTVIHFSESRDKARAATYRAICDTWSKPQWSEIKTVRVPEYDRATLKGYTDSRRIPRLGCGYGVDDLEIQGANDTITLHRRAALAKVFATNEIDAERRRQDAKWGEQNHQDLRWLGVLIEEVGEMSKEIIDGNPDKVLRELVQVAAVAHAWIECRHRMALNHAMMKGTT